MSYVERQRSALKPKPNPRRTLGGALLTLAPLALTPVALTLGSCGDGSNADVAQSNGNSPSAHTSGTRSSEVPDTSPDAGATSTPSSSPQEAGVGSDSNASASPTTAASTGASSTTADASATVPSTSAGSTTSTAPATTGAPWVMAVDPPKSLTGCQEQVEVLPDQCTTRLKCDNARLLAKCRWVAEEWLCDCYDQDAATSTAYAILGGDEESACNAGLAFCVKGQEPELGDESCSDVDVPSSAGNCELDKVCSRFADLDNGLQARVEQSRADVNCGPLYSGVEGVAACTCAITGLNYTVFGVDTSAACAPTMGACTGKYQEQELACATSAEEQLEESCELKQECGTRWDVDTAGEVFVLGKPQRAGAWCYPSESAPAHCNCTSYDGINTYSRVTNDNLKEQCRDANMLCQKDVVWETDGALTCPDVTLGTLGDSCYATGTCIQDLVGDGVTLAVTGYLNVSCERAPSTDDWTCYCTSDSSSSDPFTVTQANGLATCQSAADTCATLARFDNPDSWSAQSLDYQ